MSRPVRRSSSSLTARRSQKAGDLWLKVSVQGWVQRIPRSSMVLVLLIEAAGDRVDPTDHWTYFHPILIDQDYFLRSCTLTDWEDFTTYNGYFLWGTTVLDEESKGIRSSICSWTKDGHFLPNSPNSILATPMLIRRRTLSLTHSSIHSIQP